MCCQSVYAPVFDLAFVTAEVGKDNREDWFLKLNPLGKVPTIVCGDDVVSIAACIYPTAKGRLGCLLLVLLLFFFISCMLGTCYVVFENDHIYLTTKIDT